MKGIWKLLKIPSTAILKFHLLCSIGKMPLQCILGGTPLAVDFKSLAINPIQKNIPRAALFHFR